MIEGRRGPDRIERFGTERLVASVTALLVRNPRLTDLLDQLLAEVQAANGGQLSDDVAIVGFAVNHQS